MCFVAGVRTYIERHFVYNHLRRALLVVYTVCAPPSISVRVGGFYWTGLCGHES
jgi:hypothetical protein